MRIASINIANYRCFQSLSLRPKEGLNTMVGENSVGKSAVFSAISQLLLQTGGETAFTQDDLRYGKLGEGSTVRIELALDLDEQRELIYRLLPQPLNATKAAIIHERMAPFLNNAEVRFDWKEAVRRSYIKLGPMHIFGNKASSEIVQGGQTSKLEKLLNTLISDTATFEDLLANRDFWQAQDVEKRIGNLLSDRFRIFSEFRSRPRSSGRSTNLESFEGSDTASVLLNLKNHADARERARYTAIYSEFSDFFPHLTFEAVETQPGGQIADVQFVERGQDYAIPLSNVGAGVAELLTLLTNLVARQGYVLVIEEPELHLHPQAKRRLQEMVRESAVDNQLFVITHDPCFVDPDHLHTLTRFWATDLGTKKASLAPSITRKTIGQLQTAMRGVANREMLFARALLLVEDESQMNIILGFARTLRQDLDSAGVSVVSVDGHDGFAPYVRLAKSFQIPYLCFRDLPWGSPGMVPRKLFRALGCELERFINDAGLGSLMDEGREAVGTSKRRVAKYVGQHATADQVPEVFSTLIADAMMLAQNR